ncbi:MAG: CPBP family intramembrane metalloprotease [Nitriliruptorales bacterium]|nr:CPBP family intramembrane metalloprotease [Nitriliruptorales bacterium]
MSAEGKGVTVAVPVPWRWWDAVIVFILAQVATAALLAVIAGGAGQRAVLPLAVALTHPTLIALTLLWVRSRAPHQLGRILGPVRAHSRDLLVGAGAGLGAFVLANLALGSIIQLIVGRAGSELPAVQEGLQEALRDPVAGLTVAGAAVLLAPIGEELFFRGLLFQALRRSLRLWPAIVVSGLAFGLSHLELLAFVLLFPVGMYFAWLFHRRGSLLVPVAAHATFNLVGVALLRLGSS